MRHEAGWAEELDGDRSRTLALVLAGLTDEAAAHRLGVSKRTVQRRIRELMDLSGARNRMELGHRAALAGLPSAAGGAGRPAKAVPAAAGPVRVSVTASVGSSAGYPAGTSAVATVDGSTAERRTGRSGTRPAKAPEALDEPDRVLLRTLLTDEAPEAALGVSTRSVERRVHDLMARAGAASRAQLGWHATRRGWI